MGLAPVEVRAVEGRAGYRRHRAKVRLPVAVPGGSPEDAERERNRHGEGDDGELLRAQLVLPARTVLAVEDRTGTEGHALVVIRIRLETSPPMVVMRRLGVRRSGRRAGEAPC